MINPTMRDVVDSVSKKAAESMETEISKQLGELVDKNILMIERTEPIITIDDSNVLRVSQKVRLHLRDREYIEQLRGKIETMEDKITWLEGRLASIQDAAKNIIGELEDL